MFSGGLCINFSHQTFSQILWSLCIFCALLFKWVPRKSAHEIGPKVIQQIRQEAWQVKHCIPMSTSSNWTLAILFGHFQPCRCYPFLSLLYLIVSDWECKPLLSREFLINSSLWVLNLSVLGQSRLYYCKSSCVLTWFGVPCHSQTMLLASWEKGSQFYWYQSPAPF